MVARMHDHRSPLRVHVLRDDHGTPLLPLAAAILRFAAGDSSIAEPDPRIYRSLVRRIRNGEIVHADRGDADVLLCAHDEASHRAAVRQLLVRTTGAPVLLHTESDSLRPSDRVDGIVLRSSALASRLRPHERIATGCVPDLIEERPADEPEIAAWSPVPSIGFIGHVTAGLRSITYLRRGWQHFHGFRFRERVLRALEGSRAVNVEIVRRSRNLGPPMAGTDRDDMLRAMRAEYVRSVFRHPYSLCVRGAGNWSYRLFETLAAGRIPLLVDTDCALPLEGEIDWDQHLCRVQAGSIGRIGPLLAAFHDRLGEEGLREMQRRNRTLWSERLEPGTFFIDALQRVAAGTVSAPFSTTSRPAGRPSR